MLLEEAKGHVRVDAVQDFMARIPERSNGRFGGEIVDVSDGIAIFYESISQNRRNMDVQRYVEYLELRLAFALFDEPHVVRHMFEHVDDQENVEVFAIVRGKQNRILSFIN